MRTWQKYRYKNLTLFVLSIVFALLLSDVKAFQTFLLNIGNYGYLGAFIGGILFVSTFTVATGILILSILATQIAPWQIGLLAGLGAMVGDFAIFKFVKDRLVKELTPIYDRIVGNHFEAIVHSKYFRWTLPVMGAILIASPVPDELGVSLMGISRCRTFRFLIISFFLNTAGIFLIVYLAAAISK